MNNFMKIIIIAPLFILIGCSPMQHNAISYDLRNEMRANKKIVDEYCKKVLGDIQFKSLENLGVSTKVKDLSLAQYANPNKPNEEEKKMLLEYSKFRNSCRQKGDDHMRKYSPPIPPLQVVLWEASHFELDVLLVELYKGELSYGEYARARKENVLNYHKKKQEITELINRRNDEANFRAQQIANESRRISLEAFNNSMKSLNDNNKAMMEIFKPNNNLKTSPTITDCDRLGSGIRCTTY